MSRFVGSQFFSDTKSLEHQTYVSREYELPVFINNKFLKTNPDPSWRQQIQRHGKTYRLFYKCHNRMRPIPETVDIEMLKCPHLSKADRFQHKEHMVGLPPNRHTLTDNNLAKIVQKSTGKKGPYACFTGKRDESTLMGKMAPSKYKGSKTMFYDVPDGLQLVNNPRNYFRMKIRHGSRFLQKPYSRFMLSDLTLCPKNPKFPGPADYFKEGNIKKLLHSHYRKRKRPPSLFFPSSCVPQNTRFWRGTPISPGPGRYSPEAPACPCPRGTSYSAERERLLEIVQRHNRPVAPRIQMKPCSSPLIRNIPGHGHTFVFRSQVIRLLTLGPKRHKRKAATRNNLLQMEHDAKYIKMIMNPNRTPISRLSFDLDEVQMRPGKIRFNSIERPLKRTKLRNNKRVAFMSSCPRWSVNAIVQLLADKIAARRPVHKSPNVVRFAPFHPAAPDEPPIDRLQRLPERYRDLIPTVDHSDKMRYTFEPLPPARILVQDKLAIDKDGLQKVNQPTEPEQFYKAEILELHRVYLEQMKNYVLEREKMGGN